MLEYRELTPSLWPAIETLFGPRGACGGCWCMAWRVAHGGRLWEETKGERAHQQFMALVAAGTAHGMLAFDGEPPVGWCSFGPRPHFPRLETVKAYRREDAGEVWSINCFFIAKDYRGQGVAAALLAAALEAMRRRGVRLVEAYPATLTSEGQRLPAAFAWMGPLSLFEAAGFAEVQRLSASKPLLRKTLQPSFRHLPAGGR